MNFNLFNEKWNIMPIKCKTKKELEIILKGLPKDVLMSKLKFIEYHKNGTIPCCYDTLFKRFHTIENMCKIGGLKLGNNHFDDLINAYKKIVFNFDYLNEKNYSKSFSKICKEFDIPYNTRQEKQEAILNCLLYLSDNYYSLYKSDINDIYHKMELICSSDLILSLFETLDMAAEIIDIKFNKQIGKGLHENFISDTTEKERNIIIKRNHKIPKPNSKFYFYPDGYQVSTKTIFEIYDNDHKKPKKFTTDIIRIKKLLELGYNVEIIWQSEFFKTHELPMKKSQRFNSFK